MLAGRGLLRVINVQAGRCELVVAPVLTLTFWSLLLGLAATLRMPLREATPWLWLVSFCLAVYGAMPPFPRAKTGILLLLCFLLPVVVMRDYFRLGLADFAGSSMPDGWMWVAFGQYLWQFPRGLEPGPAPLYQYATILAESTRYAAAGLLGFFSPLVRAGDTQSVSSLLQAWTLFTVGCAAAFFWLAGRKSILVALAATALTVCSGWMADLTFANNFDQGLVLVYLPAIAGLPSVFKTPASRRFWVLLGCFIAAAFYVYSDLAPVLIAAALIFVLPWAWRGGKNPATIAGASIGLLVVAALLLPRAGETAAHLLSVLGAAASKEPGSGFFGGLHSKNLPAAFWGLGNENFWLPFRISFGPARDALGVALGAVAIAGVIHELRTRRWELALVTVLLTAGALLVVIVQQYTYGAYKWISADWWALVAALVFGAEAILKWLEKRDRWKITVGVLMLGAAGVLLAQGDASNEEFVGHYLGSRPVSIAPLRQIEAAPAISHGEPVLLLVNDFISNEWATYFLRGLPMRIASYRMYMADVAHVMERGPAPPLETIRYVVTDPAYAPAMNTSGGAWRAVWSGGPYTLWQATVANAAGRLFEIERARGAPGAFPRGLPDALILQSAASGGYDLRDLMYTERGE